MATHEVEQVWVWLDDPAFGPLRQIGVHYNIKSAYIPETNSCFFPIMLIEQNNVGYESKNITQENKWV